MQRRDLLIGAPFALLAQSSTAYAADDPAAFDAQTVRRMARALSETDYKAPDTRVPGDLEKLNYDAYRQIRFDPGQSLWRNQGLPFEVQFFHRGSIFAQRVDINEVVNGRTQPLRYRPEQFNFGPTPRPEGDLGYAGFRVHAPLNRPDYADEVVVFLGASYFRAVAKGEGYGLSARALGIKTADPGGEEFPAFKAFWLERPQPGTNSLVVWALVDSPSAAAAARFTVRPGDTTVIDVELTLYPRTTLDQAGIGGMASMFFFNSMGRAGVDDFRPAVHDSDGLMMLTGRGEQLWRPLANPRTLQVSSFVDTSPRGFGLMQRARTFSHYQDLEAHYERRPSLWIEPIGDWGEGMVQLVEIPTKSEIHDNIVAYWRPKQKLERGEHGFTYRMHWGAAAPIPPGLAQIISSRSGAGEPGTRLFALDILGDGLRGLPPEQLRADISSDKGRIDHKVLQPNPDTGGWRLSFDFIPGDDKAAELRAQILRADAPASETWIYRWTA